MLLRGIFLWPVFLISSSCDGLLCKVCPGLASTINCKVTNIITIGKRFISLQSQTGERSKRLTPTNGNGATTQKADPEPLTKPLPQQKPLGTGIDSPVTHDKTPTPTESPPLKRFVLPVNATEAEKQYFDQYIEQLKQLNPQWVVSLDYCNPGEAEAYIMIYKDDNYIVNHATYSLDKFLARAFPRTFP